MGIQTMGQVVVTAKVENLSDVYLAEQGFLTSDKIRWVQKDNAVVDTGATFVSLPPSLIKQLGLRFVRSRQAKTAAGVFSFNLYSAVRLTIQDRECISDVCEVPEDCPVLIGVLPLEAMDFVVDPTNRRLMGNPAHGGENMIDML